MIASFTVPAPFALWARGSVGFLQNNYPNDASEIGTLARILATGLPAK